MKYVFNAENLSKSEYRIIMKELNKMIAYNVTPCRQKGHTLRTRSGHCCQCDTAKIAFQKRNDSSGIVYIAGSLTGEIIKIGFSKAIEVRAESLNRTKYAGFNDWKIIYALKSKNAGRIETISNSLLYKYAFSIDYKHDGHWQDSHETYHCAYSKAKKIVEKVYQEKNYNVKIEKNSQTIKYEFRNLKNLND
ncbi:GIY-YIG nuclease family protein [Tenacibaculum aiptasiae]|uniref:GIY-YIG nuclease family protein n=1 Tax=Tenacibaculum aiptasiae TaxID=426481 RepID=UPI00232D40C7|nr:GIY-YIG nuclease family protein [Tenacibaculum aiptasiae]